MPSPTSITRPTSRTSSCSRYCSISRSSTGRISPALNRITASLDEVGLEVVEPVVVVEDEQEVDEQGVGAALEGGADGLLPVAAGDQAAGEQVGDLRPAP